MAAEEIVTTIEVTRGDVEKARADASRRQMIETAAEAAAPGLAASLDQLDGLLDEFIDTDDARRHLASLDELDDEEEAEDRAALLDDAEHELDQAIEALSSALDAVRSAVQNIDNVA